jgi:predicted deacetylase
MSVKIKVILAALFCIIIFLFSFVGLPSKEKKISVVFRYDDYSSVSSTKVEKGIIDIFRRNRLTCTFGVIPFVCSGSVHETGPQDEIPLLPEKIALLKEGVRSGAVDVALHGYSHQTTRSKAMGYTEFNGVSYENQLRKIVEGKNFLDKNIGIEMTTFIPPWNSYDLNTIACLEKSGFQTISGDFTGETIASSSLKFAPSTSAIHKARRAIQLARWNRSNIEQLIIVLFHDYDFKEVNPEEGRVTLKEVEDLVSWAAFQSDIRIESIGHLVEKETDLSASQYLTYQEFHKIVPVISLETFFPIGVYSKTDVNNTLKVRSLINVMLIYLTVFMTPCVVAYLLIFHLFKKLEISLNVIRRGCFIFLLLPLVTFVAYTMIHFEFNYRFAAMLCAVLGGGLGIMLALRKHFVI